MKINKICTKCEIKKILREFGRDVRCKDGRQSECRSCHNAYNKTDKGRLVQIKAQAKYRKSDKGKLVDIKYQFKYRKSDKGKLAHAERCAKYYKTDKGKAATARAGHKRRECIKNSKNSFTHEQWAWILEIQNHECAHCNRTFNDKLIPCRDHIVPASEGGEFTIFNVQALCVECNSKKYIKTIDYRTEFHKYIIDEQKLPLNLLMRVLFIAKNSF